MLLILDGKTNGAIAVFRSLGQQPGLEEIDLQLFDLLASQVATALYSSHVRAKSTDSAS